MALTPAKLYLQKLTVDRSLYAHVVYSYSALRFSRKTILTGEDADAKQALDGKQWVPKQKLSSLTIHTVIVKTCLGVGVLKHQVSCPYKRTHKAQFFHSSFDFVNSVHCFLQEDGTVNVGVKW